MKAMLLAVIITNLISLACQIGAEICRREIMRRFKAAKIELAEAKATILKLQSNQE